MHFQNVEHHAASLIQELEFSEFLKGKLKITCIGQTTYVVKKYRLLDGEEVQGSVCCEEVQASGWRRSTGFCML